MESEGAFHAFAYFMFECPNCKDTDRRLLPLNHPLVVDSAPALATDVGVCEQATMQPAGEEATPLEKTVTAGGKADHFLSDPAKFIERFVRNREHTRP
jgi:hypothetical protein